MDYILTNLDLFFIFVNWYVREIKKDDENEKK